MTLLASPKRHRLTDADRKLREMTEKQLDNYVRELGTKLGYLRFHTYRSDRSPAGFPDLVLIRPPHTLFAELKTELGKPTPAQVEWLDNLALSGQLVYLVKPRDLDDFANVLADPRDVGRARGFAMGGDVNEPGITHTHTTTFNAIEFADPYKVCEVCGEQVTGVLCVAEGRWPNLPCEHIGYKDTCPSWSPVDGCNCMAHLAYVPHKAPAASSPNREVAS